MQNLVISLPRVNIVHSCGTWRLISVIFVTYHRQLFVARSTSTRVSSVKAVWMLLHNVIISDDLIGFCNETSLRQECRHSFPDFPIF